MMDQALLVGLPASGKTTFIAALWHVIVSQDVDGALALEVMDAPVDHLNELVDRWLRFEEANRTSSSAEHASAIRIRSGGGELITEIVVPDLAGESIQRSVVDRQWTGDFAEFVRGSTGVLLFVHPEKIREHWSITDAVDIAGEETQSSVNPELAGESAASEWTADKVPTQVELVDLLQLLCEHIDKQHFRLAIIVSAWDLVNDQGRPSDWLAKQFPLLEQFLISARSRLDLRVYGVSAQGGRLPEDGERLQTYVKASHRIQVVRDDGAPSHDITAPLRWVVNVDAG